MASFVSTAHCYARAHLPQYGVMAPFASTTALMRRGMEDTIFAKAALWLAFTQETAFRCFCLLYTSDAADE